MKSFSIFLVVLLAFPSVFAIDRTIKAVAREKIETMGYSYRSIDTRETEKSVIFVKFAARSRERGDLNDCHLAVVVDKATKQVTLAESDAAAVEYVESFNRMDTNADAFDQVYWICVD